MMIEDLVNDAVQCSEFGFESKYCIKYTYLGIVDALPLRGDLGDVVIFNDTPFVCIRLDNYNGTEYRWEPLNSEPDKEESKTEIIPAICPNCGGHIKLLSKDHGFCEYCETEFLLK